MLRYRAALVKLQTMVKNRVHSVRLKHGFQAQVTDVFGVRGRTWLASLPLRPVYRHMVGGFLHVLDSVQEQIRVTAPLIDEQAALTPLVQKLCELPGIGRYTALLILAEIGDIHRFPTPKHLVSYAGLAPTVHSSGGRTYTGHISRQGWLRWILVEAAHHAARKPGPFQDRYRRLEQRKGAKVAYVAVARELLTTIYWMLCHAY